MMRRKAKKLAKKVKMNAVAEETNLEMLPNNKGVHNESADGSSDSATFTVMPVMMTDTTTMEDQISNLAKIIEELAVHVQSQDRKIAKLMAMMENIGENSLNVSKQKFKMQDESDSLSKEKEDTKSQTMKEFSIFPDGTIRVISFTYKEEDDEKSDVSYNHITIIDGDSSGEEEDAKDAPPELEEGVKTTVDDLKEINFDTLEDPRLIYISALLNSDEEKAYVDLLQKYRDVFVRTYKEMSGLDPKVAVKRLAVEKGVRPVKQAQRRFRLDLVPLIEVEINKLIEAGFIREVKYSTWISSIVSVQRKNEQIHIYVDFRDLNNTCPKNDFSLPITELMIDTTIGYEALSFMDGSSSYNQIRMASEDEELTSFHTSKGIYCYKVMFFGRKNTGVTYQRAMQNIFDDILH
ncbi:uncharacterized protein LOC113759587 [Coffea eugenioides]|uniref:uncharacterized protein LOC113759587 n=1 Tax=Coffea eugenioides TaxID=49369 RepID=UPI000F609ABA|nr:uncharacterized protein LOC113759587 [Coffea eugenioides]